MEYCLLWKASAYGAIWIERKQVLRSSENTYASARVKATRSANAAAINYKSLMFGKRNWQVKLEEKRKREREERITLRPVLPASDWIERSITRPRRDFYYAKSCVVNSNRPFICKPSMLALFANAACNSKTLSERLFESRCLNYRCAQVEIHLIIITWNVRLSPNVRERSPR